MTKIYLNGSLVDLPEADEEKRLAAVEVEKAAKKARTDAATAKATKKESGKKKLKDLGLDDEEIKALTGA
tara:strand:+ start:775 stop:984 length:210 start_codon:yes stop_codon:yes gene_type:complete